MLICIDEIIIKSRNRTVNTTRLKAGGNMAFDGITVNGLVRELNQVLTGGRLSKIAQPEADELLLTIKASNGNYRLLLSANAGLPLVYLTETNKPSPAVAPSFCMLLRKHIANGRILSVTQPGLERVIDMKIEHLDEMGDLKCKHLIIELMGKYSNIIFTDDEDRIIDAIKRVNAGVSSVREVLPGRPYFIPDTQNKKNPLALDQKSFIEILCAINMPTAKAIYSSYTGISPQAAEFICHMADVDSSLPASALSENELGHLAGCMQSIMKTVKEGQIAPKIFYRRKSLLEYGVLPGMEVLYAGPEQTYTEYSGVSEMIEAFYSGKETENRIRTRSADLRQVISALTERTAKKLELQEKQLKDAEKREEFRIKGELLQAYSYQIVSGSKEARVLNYYTNEEICISLDEDLSIQDNSQKYFARYNKLKRTYEALSRLVSETEGMLRHLESIDTSISLATDYEDLMQIREEMIASGYLKKSAGDKSKSVKIKSRPLHYRSSDGFDIYVGKNNLQNEELTFKVALGDDWWFHAKGVPGSHVIVKAGHRELPDRTYEEAAALAAYYSKAANQEKVEIDYVLRKEVKKVSGAAPGFVIYHTNYSMAIAPDLNGLTLISE